MHWLCCILLIQRPMHASKNILLLSCSLVAIRLFIIRKSLIRVSVDFDHLLLETSFRDAICARVVWKGPNFICFSVHVTALCANLLHHLQNDVHSLRLIIANKSCFPQGWECFTPMQGVLWISKRLPTLGWLMVDRQSSEWDENRWCISTARSFIWSSECDQRQCDHCS